MKVISNKIVLFLTVMGLLFSYQLTHATEANRNFGKNSGQSFKFIMHGAKKFSDNCAECHGPLAQGALNWHEPDNNGNYPAPPLDGTGHAWHHSKEVLTTVIKKGGKPMGGIMPPFEDKLSDTDIDSILAWLQSYWPDKVLKVWKKNYIK